MASGCDSLKAAYAMQNVSDVMPQDCCKYPGVTCAADGVTIEELQLGLDGFPINNTAAFDSITQITTLKRLQLVNQDFPQRPFPSTLGLLKNLENLDLSNAQFSGAIPPSFQNLVNLKVLTMSYNRFTGQIPGDIGKLSALTELDLGYNSFDGSLPVELFSLTQLRSLTISRNHFTGTLPIEVGRLVNVHGMDISGNNLTGPVPATINGLSSMGAGTQCKLLPNQFQCRERDIALSSPCLRDMSSLPLCSGPSSVLPPISGTPGQQPGNTTAPAAPAQTTSKISPAIYACMPILFLLGAAIAWFAANRRRKSKPALAHHPVALKDQAIPMHPQFVHDDVQTYYQPDYVLPAAAQLTLWQPNEAPMVSSITVHLSAPKTQQPATADTLIVLVHGGVVAHRMYRTVVPLLTERFGYRCAAPDLPGHGDSIALRPFTISLAVEHLAAWLREYKFAHASDRVVLVGISLGGQVVLSLLAAHPTCADSAIISGSSIHPPDDRAQWVMPRMPTDDDEWMRIIMEDVQVFDAATYSAGVQNESFTKVVVPSAGPLPPCLVVVGEHDVPMAIRDAPELIGTLKKCTDKHVQGVTMVATWHNHTIDVPERFAALVAAWAKDSTLAESTMSELQLEAIIAK
ncbi:hypothetical protein RI367_005555 [Sorochytrium milnesiophthora]